MPVYVTTSVFRESFHTCAEREVREETALETTNMRFATLVNAVDEAKDYHYVVQPTMCSPLRLAALCDRLANLRLKTSLILRLSGAFHGVRGDTRYQVNHDPQSTSHNTFSEGRDAHVP